MIVPKIVTPNPAGLPVMLIVSENYHTIKESNSPKSMKLKDLRHVVTYGILCVGAWGLC